MPAGGYNPYSVVIGTSATGIGKRIIPVMPWPNAVYNDFIYPLDQNWEYKGAALAGLGPGTNTILVVNAGFQAVVQSITLQCLTAGGVIKASMGTGAICVAAEQPVTVHFNPVLVGSDGDDIVISVETGAALDYFYQLTYQYL